MALESTWSYGFGWKNAERVNQKRKLPRSTVTSSESICLRCTETGLYVYKVNQATGTCHILDKQKKNIKFINGGADCVEIDKYFLAHSDACSNISLSLFNVEEDPRNVSFLDTRDVFDILEIFLSTIL
jgi:hypothetical protein